MHDLTLVVDSLNERRHGMIVAIQRRSQALTHYGQRHQWPTNSP